MVITITDTDIEGNSAIEFPQIRLHITAVLQDKINYIQIAIACSCITPVCQSK